MQFHVVVLEGDGGTLSGATFWSSGPPELVTFFFRKSRRVSVNIYYKIKYRPTFSIVWVCD